jgi:hypothetical protein
MENTIYESSKGKISMVAPVYYTMNQWEIYSWDTLFEDVERYDTEEQAMKRISSLLYPEGVEENLNLIKSYKINH